MKRIKEITIKNYEGCELAASLTVYPLGRNLNKDMKKRQK